MAVGVVTFAACFVLIIYIYQYVIDIFVLKLPVILPIPLPVGNGILSGAVARVSGPCMVK
jgi:hypothetical protein